MIIAVDGPTASGKGTIARRLADHFGVPHLDTGLLYRAVGRQVGLDEGDPDNEAHALAACAFPDALLEDEALRSEAVGSLASRVSVHPAVREALFKRQRAFAEQAGGAVLDGRDIGTVICPDAAVKLFVVASDAVRASRRHEELRARGLDTELQSVLEDIRARDARDAEREAAPMKPAEDAILLDTTDLSIEDAVRQAIEHIAKALPET